MKVIKRTGQEVDFNSDKIFKAINKASSETELGIDYELSREIADSIEDDLEDLEFTPNIEYIQNLVEDYLMQSDRRDIAKAYILYREKRSKLRNKGWEMTDLQRDIYEQKYRFENESFDEFLDRVSGGNNEVKKLIRDKKFLPAGRILAGRGLNERGKKVCYSNCFVITPPEDNLESIFDTAKKMARTYSFGGGCGTSLEHLRPRGSKVNNAAQSTTGSVSFAELYSTTTGLIGQNSRRGALMLTLPVTHPDILEFINIKRDLNKVTKANISVMITDDFMKAVKSDSDWTMQYIVKDTGEVIEKTVRARDIIKAIASSSHAMAEPGTLLWDKVQNWHINSENPDFKYTSTNPCGEKPLTNGGSCLLGSLNLDQYVKYPFSDNCKFDLCAFEQDTRDVTVYMNEVLDEGIQYLPLDEQKESVKKHRQLGIGIMGMADMFIKMRVVYGSEESKQLISKILSVMANASLQESSLLAKKYGTYEVYNKEAVLKSPYLNFVATKETLNMIKEYGLRNAELLSIAPTGSLSTMLGVSGGCEPIFANSFSRKSESLGVDGQFVYYKVYTSIVKEYMSKFNIINEEDLPNYFVTAMDLNYRKRIELQGVLQLYIDSAISSTVNLSEETTIEEIEDLYIYAWEKGLKGITIYRDNCERTGILNTDKNKPSNRLDKIDELKEQLDKLALEEFEEHSNLCPLCGSENLMHSNGCVTCVDCGYSPCSI